MALNGVMRYGNVPMFGTAVFRRWAERADRYAAAGTIARARADMAMAQACLQDGRLTEALSLRGTALALARQLGDAETFSVAAATFMTGMWFSPAGQVNVESIVHVAGEVSNYFRQGVSARTTGTALQFCGYVYLNTGDRNLAEAAWQGLADLAQRTKDTHDLLRSLTNEIHRALLDGDLEAAAVAAAHVGSSGDELGAPVTGRMWAAYGFRALLHLNRAAETPEVLWEAGRPSGQATERGVTAWGERSRRALVLAYLGRPDEAQAALHQLLAELRVASEDHVMTTPTGVNLLETALLLKDQQATALLASRLQPVASLAYGGLAFTCVARHLGAAAALLGNGEAARAYYAQALEVCGRLRFRPEIALTHLQLAELLLDEGVGYGVSSVGGGRGTSLSPAGGGRGEGETRAPASARAEAWEHLDFAIAELREMKMMHAGPVERAVAHALSVAGAMTGPSPKPPSSDDPLSPREREVAALVARGFTNHEIATELVISEGTAKRHVENILGKLGLSTRQEVRRWAAEQPLLAGDAGEGVVPFRPRGQTDSRDKPDAQASGAI